MISNELMQVAKDTASLKTSVLNVLKYFHVFRHPLRTDEIHRFLNTEVPHTVIAEIIYALLRDGTISQSHNLYSLENSSQIFLKRIVGEELAKEKMKEARKSAAIISRFPFVKSVCISGSLSKGYADENSDIDFFIITSTNRLWICRTLLHLFKKLTFLVNKQHSFCMNYFIDESKLTLEEQNVFTATELATLIPAYNTCVYKNLMQHNEEWMLQLFPNYTPHDTGLTITEVRGFKLAIEWVFNKLWPQRLNNFLMKLTDRMWRYKWRRKSYPIEDYDLAMKTRWYVSKQHPLNYQKKVLQLNNITAV